MYEPVYLIFNVCVETYHLFKKQVEEIYAQERTFTKTSYLKNPVSLELLFRVT